MPTDFVARRVVDLLLEEIGFSRDAPHDPIEVLALLDVRVVSFPSTSTSASFLPEGVFPDRPNELAVFGWKPGTAEFARACAWGAAHAYLRKRPELIDTRGAEPLARAVEAELAAVFAPLRNEPAALMSASDRARFRWCRAPG